MARHKNSSGKPPLLQTKYETILSGVIRVLEYIMD